MDSWMRWFIVKDGIFIVARYHGTREDAEQYCREYFTDNSYQVSIDNRNENHPVNKHPLCSIRPPNCNLEPPPRFDNVYFQGLANMDSEEA